MNNSKDSSVEPAPTGKRIRVREDACPSAQRAVDARRKEAIPVGGYVPCTRPHAAALALMASLVTLSGCGKPEGSSQASMVAKTAAASAPTAPSATAGEAGKAAGAKADANGKDAFSLVALTDSQPDRYLIKNATVSIETSDVRKVAEQLVGFARGVHGYVSDSHETVDELGARSITMQLRVPATQFEASMQQIETLGKMLDKQVNTEDVTEEFVDSQARLRNLKSAELRLLDHLSKTGKLSDTLLIEKELTRTRQEIEQIEGRLKFLAHRIAYSTFSITVRETPKMQPIVPAQSFSGGKVVSDATRSLVDFGQNLESTLIWLAVWAIFWLPLTLLARFLFRRHKRALTGLYRGTSSRDVTSGASDGHSAPAP